MAAKVVRKERHIGLDQGCRNFAIVAVDKEMDAHPVLVAAQKYDLHIPQRFTAEDVLVRLR